jgi:hypothetical protein
MLNVQNDVCVVREKLLMTGDKYRTFLFSELGATLDRRSKSYLSSWSSFIRLQDLLEDQLLAFNMNGFESDVAIERWK